MHPQPPATTLGPSDCKPHRLRRAIGFAADRKSAVALIVTLTLLVGVASSIEPLVLRATVDGLSARDGVRQLVQGIVALVGIYLFREWMSALGDWLTWRTRLRVHYSILDATVGRLNGMSVAFHRSEPVGALMTRLDRGIQGMLTAFSEVAFNFLPSLVFLVLSLVMMMRLEWRLALVLVFVLPLPAIVGALAARVQTRRERTLLDRWMRIYGRFNEVLSGIVTVKSFAMEHEEKRRFMEHVVEANGVVARGVGFDASVAALEKTLAALARVVVVGWGGLMIIRGEITVGTLLAFLGYLSGLFTPVQGLIGIYQTLCRARVSLDTVFSILDHEDSVPDLPGARELRTVHGHVSFDNVVFGYQSARPVLRGVSFDVKAGEMVAFVGPSGTGKTTVLSLLQRFYDPDSGAVRLDGVDVRDIKQRSLRRHIGVVLQDALLFNESVAANIAYGRPEASRREVEDAARAANAHDFICNLANGYETEVGERGGLLSVGQRQRIAIARVLLKSPRVVVLDEATSALDAESEALVQEALERLLRGRTTFVVAHRLATVMRADRILVMRGGHIVEIGTHGELLRQGGHYAGMVKLQTRGLLAA